MRHLAICLLACVWCGAGLGAIPHPAVEHAAGAMKNRAGLVVCLGSGSAEDLVALSRNADSLVHCLVPDAAGAQSLQQAAVKSGLCGRIWAESASRLDPLPYNNSLANVVVVNDFAGALTAGLQAAEVRRILAPTGTAIIGQPAGAQVEKIRNWLSAEDVSPVATLERDGVWVVFRKNARPGIDEFSHKWKSPARNLGTDDAAIAVPDTIRWMTVNSANGGEFRTAGARLFLLARRPASAQAQVDLTSFDAFSGVRQWTASFPSAKTQLPWIATADHVIAQSGEQVICIDAATGKQRLVYESAGAPEDMLVSDGALVCTEPFMVRALDVQTGKELWTMASQSPRPEKVTPRKGAGLGGHLTKAREGGFETYCVVAAEGKVFLLDYFVGPDKKPSAKMLGVNLRTGKVEWSSDDELLAGGYRKYCYYAGQLIISTPGALLGLPVSGGGQRWKHDALSYDPKTQKVTPNIGNGKSIFASGGLVWVRIGETDRGRSVIIDPADKPQPFKQWIGLDPKTGQEKTRIGYTRDDGTWQQRCYPDSATPNFIYSSNSEFIDTKNRDFRSWRIMRGICGEGPIYGSGTMYIPPAFCYWCYPMVRGGLALDTAPPRRIAVAEDQRLEKGPAYGEQGPAPKIEPSDWPMFRRDMTRTGGATASGAWPLKSANGWPKQLGTRIHAPLIVGDRLYVTAINQGRIIALSADGGELWQYAAGSRIDLPPTLHGGLLLFGCHDGKVHAIRASDGALAWRFCLAPEVRRMVATDVVESPWPVMGSILVIDGIAYASAGRITGLDGGLRLCALDAATGQPKWLRTVGPSYGEMRLRTGATNNPAGYWKKPLGPTEGQMTNSVLVHAGGDELRLIDQDFVWRFNRRDGAFILAEKGTSYPHSDYSAAMPWHGFGRLSLAGMQGGTSMFGEFLIRGGMVVSFPEPTSAGLAFGSAQKVGYVLMGCRPEGVRWVRDYENKEGGIAPAWGPITYDLLVDVMMAVGDKGYIAGRPMIRPEGWTTATKPPTNYDQKTVPMQIDGAAPPELRCLSLADGKELGRMTLPAAALREGAMSHGHGRLYIALEDGQLLGLEAAR